MKAREHRRNRGSTLVGMSVALSVVSAAFLGSYVVLGQEDIPAASPVVPQQQARLSGKVSREQPMQLRIGDSTKEATWKALGLKTADTPRGQGEAIFDYAVTKSYFLQLKQQYDRSPRNARLDLESRQIFPEENGQSIDVYGAIAAVNTAAYQGKEEVTLPVVALPADVTRKDLGIEDISHVLAMFKTRFAIKEKYRNDNLKLAASKLNGYVMRPGEIFSFMKWWALGRNKRDTKSPT